MSVVLCDASSLIFLAKIDRLDLIFALVEKDVVVLQCVIDEVLTSRGLASELHRLNEFLKRVSIVNCSPVFPSASALSESDQTSLEWAVEQKVHRLVVDERLLRKVAQARGVQVIGVLGILLKSRQAGLLTPPEAREAVEALVTRGMRISTLIYQEVIRELSG